MSSVFHKPHDHEFQYVSMSYYQNHLHSPEHSSRINLNMHIIYTRPCSQIPSDQITYYNLKGMGCYINLASRGSLDFDDTACLQIHICFGNLADPQIIDLLDRCLY